MINYYLNQNITKIKQNRFGCFPDVKCIGEGSILSLLRLKGIRFLWIRIGKS